jgi:hypothetical protein
MLETFVKQGIPSGCTPKNESDILTFILIFRALRMMYLRKPFIVNVKRECGAGEGNRTLVSTCPILFLGKARFS